jgi:hypothetical protein
MKPIKYGRTKNDHLITTVFDLGFSEFLGIENKC